MRSVISPVIILLVSLTSSSYAIGNLYLDGMGAFTQTIDAKNQFGGGGALLYQIGDDFNFFIKNIITVRKIGSKTTAGEKYYDRYNFFMSTAGIEYLYSIGKMPLFWKNSLGMGAGSASITEDYDPLSGKNVTDKHDTGLCFAAWTGLMYVFTQNISACIDIGFHKTYFYDELEDENIMGVQLLIGARLTLWGQNQSIYGEY